MTCLNVIQNLQNIKKETAVQLTPPRRGLGGNDTADLLVKKGATVLQPQDDTGSVMILNIRLMKSVTEHKSHPLENQKQQWHTTDGSIQEQEVVRHYSKPAIFSERPEEISRLLHD